VTRHDTTQHNMQRNIDIRPARLLQLIVSGILILYATRLAWGRGALFMRSWRHASRDYYVASEQHEDCASSHATLHRWADACAHASEVVAVWPIIHAWDTLLENTYLCVEVPCSVLFESFVGTLYGLVLTCCILVFAAAVAMAKRRPQQDTWEPHHVSWMSTARQRLALRAPQYGV